jgi:hypothetical protein
MPLLELGVAAGVESRVASREPAMPILPLGLALGVAPGVDRGVVLSLSSPASCTRVCDVKVYEREYKG